MAKKKAGLHKKVSSIFEGVPVPGQNAFRDKKTPVTGETPAKDREPVVGPSRHILDEPAADVKHQEKKTPEQTPAKPTPKSPVAAGRKEYKLSAPIPGVSDRKEKIKVAMLPILSIILVIVLISVFKDGSSSGTSTKASKNAKKTDDSGLEVEPDALISSNVIITWKPPDKYPNTLRDPMEIRGSNGSLTKGETAKNASSNGSQGREEYLNVVIRSILYSDAGRSVIIGDEILSEGDTVSGALIKKINKDNVEFEKNGKTFSIKLLRIKTD